MSRRCSTNDAAGYRVLFTVLRLRLVALPAILLSAFVVLGHSLSTQAESKSALSYVTSGNSAYVLMAPRPIAVSGARALHWSPLGQGMIVECRERIGSTFAQDEEEISLVGYHVARGTTFPIAKGKGNTLQLESIGWFAGTNRGVVVLSERGRAERPDEPVRNRQYALLVDADRGSVTVIRGLSTDFSVSGYILEMSPTKAVGSVTWYAGVPDEDRALAHRISVLGSDGTVSAPMTLPADATPEGWTADGQSLLISYSGANRRAGEFDRVDLATGLLTSTNKGDYWKGAKQSSEVTARLIDGSLHENESVRKLKSGWIFNAKGSEKALVATDCSYITLAPELEGVAYLAGGVASIRPIQRVPKDVLISMLREVTMANAKQAALATSMYSADYDDTLPGSGFDMQDVLGPYAKDRGIFEGFVWTFQGGDLSKLTSPGSTEIGHIGGPGGRAVIYADGSVRWIPDK